MRIERAKIGVHKGLSQCVKRDICAEPRKMVLEMLHAGGKGGFI